MNSLIIFLLGIIFAQAIQPILSSFTDLFLTWIEVYKLKMSVRASEYNKQIISNETPPAHQIGFTYTPQEEEDDYTDD